MSSQLQVDKTIQGNNWQIIAFILPGGSLPANIFVYENTGTTTLGPFYGTASVEDLTRMQSWTGLAIPIFGNKFVLYNQAKIYVDPTSTTDSVIAMLVNSVRLLSIAMTSTSSTQVINIP